MPETVVKCSLPECGQAAVAKVAAPWMGGTHAELKTFGYTCSDHADSVVAYAERRPKAECMSSAESVGGVGTFPLGAR